MSWFGNIPMKPKLIGLFLIVGIIPLALVGWRASTSSSEALMKQTFSQLEAVREIKKQQLLDYFESGQADMSVLLDTAASLQMEAFSKLEVAQDLKKNHLEDYFETMRAQLKVLRDDPYTMQALIEFNQAFEDAGDTVDSFEWKSLARRYDSRFKDIMEDNGWYDVFLIHTDGDIVYTAAKESDLGQIIPDGELKDSGLGLAFAKIQEMDNEGVAVSDFQPYAPSDGAQAAFMMAKMVDATGTVVGYVAFQMPVERINAIVQERTGMGETGETYIVGKLGDTVAFRSDLQTMGDGKYVIGFPINTDYIDRLMSARKPFNGVYTDSKGNMVMIAADPLDIPGLEWGSISKIDLEEVIVPVLEGKDYFAHYIEEYGYYDLFLIHPKGRIFYTVTHESDYNTNLIDGEYADSNLGKLFRTVLETKQFGMADVAPYAPSNGAPAAFMALPFVEDGEVGMVVALQMSLEDINAVMHQRQGMGETGETYLVGSDKRMRSDSLLDPDGHSVTASFAGTVEKNGVDTAMVNKALAGKSGVEISEDYNGNSVLSAYAPLQFAGLNWALMAEIDEAEVRAPIDALKSLVAWTGGLTALVVAVVALLVALSITVPLQRVVNFAKSTARGDFNAKLTVQQGDEIGQMARAVRQIPETLNSVVSEISTTAKAVRLGRLRQRGDRDRFEGAFADLVGSVNSLADVYVGYMDDIPLPLLTMDKEHNMLFLNKAAADAGDTLIEKQEGRKCYDLFNTSHCQTDDCACAQAMKNMDHRQGSTDAHPAGKDLEITYTGIPILNEDGSVAGALEIVVDNTEVVRAQRKMQQLAQDATGISSRLSSAAEQLSAQVEQSSRGAEIQTERAAETATSMEEMNATVLEVAQNASNAAQNADATREKAEAGSKLVGQVVDAINQVHELAQGLKANMAELGGQAESIGRIMDVITDIADQTNLLALNAAIEAARAGEAGRGFAVVADEVRKLAEKTMSATREVGDAIHAIQEGTRRNIEETDRAAEVVAESTKLAQRSGESLAEIVELAEGTADQVRAIATASEEQSAASEEVTRATEEINRISSETSETMIQSSQAVLELANLSQQLNSLIGEMNA